jgi:acyl carrier protein
MPSNVDIIPIFREAAREVAGEKLKGLDTLTLDTKLSDLALDSVAVMEVIGMVEERLHVRFDDGDLSRLSTVRDLSTLVEKGRPQS